MKKIKHIALFMLMAFMGIGLVNAQCLVPTGLSTSSLSATSAQLDWDAMPGAAFYNIEVKNGKNNAVFFKVKSNPVSNTFTITGLTAGSIYKFKVRTRCSTSGGNKSDWSARLQFAAGGGTFNCVQVTGLALTNTTANSATFSWNAIAGGLGYRVKVEDGSGNPVNFIKVANTTANSYTVTGLNPSSNYKVKVRKRCAPGVVGQWSTRIFFSTTTLRLGNEFSFAATNEMTLYPVPARDILKINFQGQMESNSTSISIFDITGRSLYSKNYESNLSEIEIPVSDLPNGQYYVQVKNTSTIEGKKIIVMH